MINTSDILTPPFKRYHDVLLFWTLTLEHFEIFVLIPNILLSVLILINTPDPLTFKGKKSYEIIKRKFNVSRAKFLSGYYFYN